MFKQKLLIFFISLILLASCSKVDKQKNTANEAGKKSSGESQNLYDMDDIYGKYVIKSHEIYGGGLTTNEEADSYIGNAVTFDKDVFITSSNEIKNPIYKIIRIPTPREGEIISEYLSVRYGYEYKRNDDNYYLIGIYETEDDLKNDTVYTHYEIISGDSLLNMFDGRFYFLEKVK